MPARRRCLPSSSPTRAAAPPVGRQAAGWYRYKVGSHEITVVTDGINRFRFPDGFVSNRNREQINQELASLYMGLEKDQIAIPYCPCAVNTGSKLVVIDTGTGEGTLQKQGRRGANPDQSQGVRHQPSQVDSVVISHFHGDHINGLLLADGKPSYPNAEIMVPAPEWKYFMDDAEMKAIRR